MEKKDTLFTRPYMVGILALISCLMWGSAFPAIKLGYELFEIGVDDTFQKILFAGVRFFIAGSMILTIILLTRKSIRVKKPDISGLILLGILQTAINYTFFYIGLSNTSGTKSSIISSTETLFAVIISSYFYREDKLTNKKIIGLVIGFVGVVLVNLNPAGVAGGFAINGEGFILMTALTGALSAIYTKKVAKNMDTFLVTGYQLIIGSLFLMTVGFFVGGERLNFNSQNIWLLLYLSIASALAFSIWTILLKYNGVGKVTIFKFSVPLFGTFLSYIVLDERLLGPNVILAIVLVSLSIILINIDGIRDEKTLE